MQSIGYDLDRWRRAGTLHFHAVRPTLYGLEMHLASIHKRVLEVQPTALVMDPVTNMMGIGDSAEIRSMMTRVIDFLKNLGITTVFTSLTSVDGSPEQCDIGISSLMDTWVLIQMVEVAGERQRRIYVLKSRGMSHSHQKRALVITDSGIRVETPAEHLAREGH